MLSIFIYLFVTSKNFEIQKQCIRNMNKLFSQKRHQIEHLFTTCTLIYSEEKKIYKKLKRNVATLSLLFEQTENWYLDATTPSRSMAKAEGILIKLYETLTDNDDIHVRKK